MTIYWGNGDRPALGSMTPTALLSDGSAGNTSTYETGSDSLPFSGSCATRSVTAAITALVDFGCPYLLTSFQFTIAQRLSTWLPSTCTVVPGDPFEEETWTEEAEWSTDGVSWTPISLTALNVAAGTSAKSGLMLSLRYLRIVARLRFRDVQDNGTISARVRLSDLRTTATLLPPASAPSLTGPAGCEGPQNTITWTSVPCADGYEIQPDAGTIIDVGVATSYAHTGLIVPSTHTYRVRAYNSAGSGPWSTLLTGVSTCVVAVAPLPPTVRALSGCFGEEVRLYLEASSGAVEWRIYRIDATGNFPISGWLTTRPTADDPFVDSPRPIGHAATYYALARNSIGTSAASAGVSIAACLPGCDCTVWTLERCV